jgi:hypothetical protein
MELQISKIDDLKWVGKINIPIKDIYTGEQKIKVEIVCEFEYYKDIFNQIWVNKISTHGDLQGKGYGTFMIQKALEVYGIIYFSNASQFECKNYSNDKQNDYRYTTDNFEDSDFGKFTYSLIKKGIIDTFCIKNPFI